MEEGARKKTTAIGIVITLLVLLLIIVFWNKKISTPKPQPASVPNVTQEDVFSSSDFSLLVQDEGANPVYVMRLMMAGRLSENEDGSQLRGSGYFPWDSEKRLVNFKVRGRSHVYVVGICRFAQTCAYASRIENMNFSDLQARTGNGSLIQIKVATSGLEAAEKQAITRAMEAAKNKDFQFAGLTLSLFEIDIGER